MLKRMTPVVAIMALMLVISACGDDTTETTANPNNQQLTASARSFAYTPADWTVSAGKDVTLTLTNTSDTEHEWVIMKTPIEAEADFTEEAVFWEVEAGAGETVTASFTPPAAGTYQIICGLEGHFTAGMKGQLTVTP